jgi:hypothetical protein
VLIDRILDFPQSLWLLAFTFYVIDCTRLVEPGCLLLAERGNGRLRPTLSRVPFEFRGRELYAPALLAPWRGVFATQLGNAPTANIDIGRSDEVRRRLWLARAASSSNFVLLFLFAPVLTWKLGLGAAILIVAPIVYFINVATGAYTVRMLSDLMLTRGQALWLFADALLCAPYGANWVKRITRRVPQLDGAPAVWERIDNTDIELLELATAGRREDASVTED